MAHFQDRRAGGERRQYKGEERRKNTDRRNNTSDSFEFAEKARFNAWMVMTDKSGKDW